MFKTIDRDRVDCIRWQNIPTNKATIELFSESGCSTEGDTYNNTIRIADCVISDDDVHGDVSDTLPAHSRHSDMLQA